MSAAHGATGKPAASRNDFSAMRSWAIATALTGGATTTSRASRCNAAAGGFSNSVVTALQRAGELVESGVIVVGGNEMAIGHRPGGGGGIGIEHDRAIARQAGGDDGVASELPSAEHPDRGRRSDRGLAAAHVGGAASRTDAAACSRRSDR